MRLSSRASWMAVLVPFFAATIAHADVCLNLEDAHEGAFARPGDMIIEQDGIRVSSELFPGRSRPGNGGLIKMQNSYALEIEGMSLCIDTTESDFQPRSIYINALWRPEISLFGINHCPMLIGPFALVAGSEDRFCGIYDYGIPVFEGDPDYLQFKAAADDGIDFVRFGLNLGVIDSICFSDMRKKDDGHTGIIREQSVCAESAAEESE